MATHRSTRNVLLPLVVLALLGSFVVLLQNEAVENDATRPHDHAQALAALPTKLPTPMTAESVTTTPQSPYYSEYECLGWRATTNCTPDGAPDPTNDEACDVKIAGGRSGYCLYRHRVSNATMRVLPMHCNAVRNGLQLFDCASAPDLIEYGPKALAYQHDPSLSFDAIQNQTRTDNNATDSVSFTRGITMVVHHAVLASAYASIRYLRELETQLPIEVWHRPDEVARDHPLLHDLFANYGVLLRTIADPNASKYYTKLYAIFYSAFDQVLFLDADNFAVRDPTFLFVSPEFEQNGAIFWPDFWWPEHTTCNIQKTSLLWQVLGLPFVNMFEQESGQILIDRRRHWTALNVLMYYGFSQPRVLEPLVWGDKDLFRLAWLKANSSFYMIPTPPASAGFVETSTNRFCGLTMGQYDPNGEILFLHRNARKLRLDTLKPHLWTYIFQFKSGIPHGKYIIHEFKMILDVDLCYGRNEDIDTFEDFTLTPIDAFPFGALESRLLELVDEAGSVIYNGQKPLL